MTTDDLPVIDAPRVRLRGIEDSDLDQIYAIYSDPKVMRYWSTPPLQTMDEALELLREIQESTRNGAILKWGVCLKPTDKLIGTVRIFNLDLTQGRVK